MASMTHILQRRLFVTFTTREGHNGSKYLEKGTAISLDERTEDGLNYHRLTFTVPRKISLIPQVAHARKEDIDCALTPPLPEISYGKYRVCVRFMMELGWLNINDVVNVVAWNKMTQEEEYWTVSIEYGNTVAKCDYQAFCNCTKKLPKITEHLVNPTDLFAQEYPSVEASFMEKEQRLIDQEKDSLRAVRNRLIEEHRSVSIKEVIKAQPKKYEGQYHGPVAHSSMKNPQMGPGYKQLDVGYDDPTGDDFLVGVN